MTGRTEGALSSAGISNYGAKQQTLAGTLTGEYEAHLNTLLQQLGLNDQVPVGVV
jgi:hypothetical protein